MPPLTPSQYRALLRLDFAAFIERCFCELNPQAEFLSGPHIEVLAGYLDACRQGHIQRLVVNIPPRHLKSLAASVALPAWWLGHDPTAQILCVSYAQDLSDKLARDSRTIMAARWYRDLFATRLSDQKSAVGEFTTTRNGFRLATSVGGVLTGRGGDVIIIDDPLKPDEARSEVQRKSCNEWYSHTLLSRLNDKRMGRIILIMQRLHEDDLAGHVLAQDGWTLLRFPAIAEEDEAHAIDTPLRRVAFTRRAGEALHPAREPLETLAALRREIGEYNFAGQYQQAPAPAGGGMVKEAWFRRYGPDELPEAFDQVLQSWDTANKPSELADYSVCTTWGIKDAHLYLLDVFRRRLAYPDLKRAVRALAQAHAASVVLIEDKASGTQLIQELNEEGVHAVTRHKPEHDKVMRLHAQTATIENGFVHLPREAHWLADYLAELTSFPKSKHDDQTDSTSQALAWMKQRPPGWGIMEYYRREAEKLRNPPPAKMVRLRAPHGVTHVIRRTGETVLVGADGTVAVSEAERGTLLGAGFEICS